MDDNVMKRYTMKSDEARHYVQYDQGKCRSVPSILLGDRETTRRDLNYFRDD